MGQTLGEPITNKETASCANSYYKVGSSSMQGWRINMEDAHTHLLTLPDDKDAAFFAVYDGHGGAKVSQYATEGKIEEAIKRGFLEFDEQLFNSQEKKGVICGTTAITVLIKGNSLYCGNVGDSRAVASVSGKVHILSFDHKPCNAEETRRILAAGGFINKDRVNGSLALSRALGDFFFKTNSQLSVEEQIVTADPEITKCEITPEFEFIVLACDGIWDVMSNHEVVQFCREGLLLGKEPEQICEELLDRCLSPDCEESSFGCDNMTVVLVVLLQNRTFKEYQEILASKPTVECDNYENLESKKSLFLTLSDSEEHFSTPSQSPTLDDTLDSCDNTKFQFSTSADIQTNKTEKR